MDVKTRKTEEYLLPNGKSPFEDWLNSLKDNKAQAIVDSRLTRVRSGNFGNCEPVGEGVQELKIYWGPGLRVYFGLDGDELVILLIGGDKSTQSKDIETAKAYWKDYKS